MYSNLVSASMEQLTLRELQGQPVTEGSQVIVVRLEVMFVATPVAGQITDLEDHIERAVEQDDFTVLGVQIGEDCDE